MLTIPISYSVHGYTQGGGPGYNDLIRPFDSKSSATVSHGAAPVNEPDIARLGFRESDTGFMISYAASMDSVSGFKLTENGPVPNPPYHDGPPPKSLKDCIYSKAAVDSGYPGLITSRPDVQIHVSVIIGTPKGVHNPAFARHIREIVESHGAKECKVDVLPVRPIIRALLKRTISPATYQPHETLPIGYVEVDATKVHDIIAGMLGKAPFTLPALVTDKVKPEGQGWPNDKFAGFRFTGPHKHTEKGLLRKTEITTCSIRIKDHWEFGNLDEASLRQLTEVLEKNGFPRKSSRQASSGNTWEIDNNSLRVETGNVERLNNLLDGLRPKLPEIPKPELQTDTTPPPGGAGSRFQDRLKIREAPYRG